MSDAKGPFTRKIEKATKYLSEMPSIRDNAYRVILNYMGDLAEECLPEGCRKMVSENMIPCARSHIGREGDYRWLLDDVQSCEEYMFEKFCPERLEELGDGLFVFYMKPLEEGEERGSNTVEKDGTEYSFSMVIDPSAKEDRTEHIPAKSLH